MEVALFRYRKKERRRRYLLSVGRCDWASGYCQRSTEDGWHELGPTSLLQAAANGRTDVVKDLLKMDCVCVNQRVRRASLPLSAAPDGPSDSVKELLKMDVTGIRGVDELRSACLLVAAANCSR